MEGRIKGLRNSLAAFDHPTGFFYYQDRCYKECACSWSPSDPYQIASATTMAPGRLLCSAGLSLLESTSGRQSLPELIGPRRRTTLCGKHLRSASLCKTGHVSRCCCRLLLPNRNGGMSLVPSPVLVSGLTLTFLQAEKKTKILSHLATLPAFPFLPPPVYPVMPDNDGLKGKEKKAKK